MAAVSAVVLLLLVAALFVEAGRARLGALAALPPWQGPGPRVSVVVAARNEAAQLPAALASWLAQDYDDFEVLLVDDRSTDGTAAVAAAAADPRLRVLRVERLPAGWLGKPHALACGARAARGELLLFTDADVVFAPTTLRRAVRALEDGRLDHLTLLPELRAPTPALRAAFAVFGLFFLLLLRPWRGGPGIGVGAFNLVRRRAYEAIGGHAALRWAVVDDVALGQRLRAAGARQGLLLGHGLVHLRWYPSVAALVRGLEKNAFAILGYRWSLVALATIAAAAVWIWPFLAPFLLDGPAAGAHAAVALGLALLVHHLAARQGLRTALLFAVPVWAGLLLVILWRSAWWATWRGAVVWRGTRYPLRLLRITHRWEVRPWRSLRDP